MNIEYPLSLQDLDSGFRPGGQQVGSYNTDMTEPKRLTAAILPFLTEEDFEQMRVDTRKLLAQNEQLRQRIAQLEFHIVTNGWAERKLH
jgi:hypothetical protein